MTARIGPGRKRGKQQWNVGQWGSGEVGKWGSILNDHLKNFLNITTSVRSKAEMQKSICNNSVHISLSS